MLNWLDENFHSTKTFNINYLVIIKLTYREKKNSVSAAMASLELPDDHVMPVGLPNMYTHIKIRSRQCDENVEGPGELLIGRCHI